jgi:hypothetical protein
MEVQEGGMCADGSKGKKYVRGRVCLCVCVVLLVLECCGRVYGRMGV